MRLQQALNEYLKFRTTAGYSKNTVDNDRVLAKKFLAVTGDVDTKRITPQHVDRFFEHLVSGPKRYAPGTINGHHAALASFFRWCRARGHMKPDYDPFVGRRYLPQPAKAMPRVPMAKFPALLDAAKHPRDRILIACGLYLMARQSEITSIRLGDVDLQTGEIHMIIFKSKVVDSMPISQELHSEITRWLKFYQEECGPLDPSWYLVPTMKYSPYGMIIRPTKQMKKPELPVKKALAEVGVTGKHIGMHVLRRSSARALHDEMTERGYDGALRRVSAWLHHKSVTVTETYLGMDIDRAQRDQESKFKTLFPSLAADNVIDLGSRKNGEADAAAL